MKALLSIRDMATTAIFLFALRQYVSTHGPTDSAAAAMQKGEEYLKEMDHRYPSMYYHLELGSSWTSAAKNLLRQLQVVYSMLKAVGMVWLF